MAREARDLTFAEKNPFLVFIFKLVCLGLFVWIAALIITSLLAGGKYKQQVSSYTIKNRLEYLNNLKSNCIHNNLNDKNDWSCLGKSARNYPVSDRIYEESLAVHLLLQKGVIVESTSENNENEKEICEWVENYLKDSRYCKKGYKKRSVSLDLNSNIESIADWYSAEAVLRTFKKTNIKYHCVMKQLSEINNLKECVSEMSLSLREKKFSSGQVTFLKDFHNEVLKEVQNITKDRMYNSYIKARWNPKRILKDSLNSTFFKMLVMSVFLLIVMLAGIWMILISMAVAQTFSKKIGISFLMVFSLPSFAVALLIAWLANFDPLHTHNNIKIILVGIVGIIAGGITFDVGRRVLILVDEEMNSPVIRGLEHFGLRYLKNRNVFNIIAITFLHIKITLSDVFGIVKHGLENEKRLEHFVLRAVEYRLIEYLGVRTSYIVDNLIVLGLIFSSVGLVSNVFKNMVVEENPLLVFQGITAMIVISLMLRCFVGLIHWRLFPNYKR